MTPTAEGKFARLLLRACATVVCAIGGGAVGALLAYWTGFLLIELDLIRADTFVDDDLALKNIGIAFAGALAGAVVGAAAGWRVLPRHHR